MVCVSLCLCVCVSVTTFSATARYNAHNKTYHRLQQDIRKVLNFFKNASSGNYGTYSTKAAIFLTLFSISIYTNGANYASEKGLSAVLHNIAHEMVSLWMWSRLPLHIVCSNNSKSPMMGAPSAEGLYFSVFHYNYILYMLQRCLKEIISGADVVLSTLTGASPEGSLRYCSYHEHYDYDSVCLD